MIRIGTRTSKLAMIQTELVKQKIQEHFPKEKIEIVPIITKGDVILHQPLASFGGKGVFTQEIEQQLLDKTIDIAVHSAKDVPMQLADGLCIGAVLAREDCRDVLVTRTGISAKDLPAGSVIGTSSLRRELQIKAMNPFVEIRMLRGNVPTRLQKLKDGQYDGIILAAAGLKRLHLEQEDGLFYEYFSKEDFLPAAGQGILAVEICKDSLKEVMDCLNDENARAVLMAERAFLTALDGSCNAPCGVCCEKSEDGFWISGMYAKDGKNLQRVDKKTDGTQPADAVALAENVAASLKVQTVSLVGAGPGAKDLMSLRALECVRRADVIIYDNLISPSILNEAKTEAKLLYVGKRANAHFMEQEEINRLIVGEAKKGGYVVRLKGGDPFIFGRGGEEALALKNEGIPFEIVSGISSSYSVPAAEGIPVTHRGCAASVHIITGHEGKEKKQAIDYAVLAKEEGTLVFLMGLGRIDEITQKLIQYGKDVKTPAAVISNGLSARQQSVTGILENIAVKVHKEKIKTPAIIVIGEVAALSEELMSAKQKPLSGKRILLTGTRSLIAKQEDTLKQLGAETVDISLIETYPCREAQTQQILSVVSDYSWIVFASAMGVHQFFAALSEVHVDRRKLGGVKFAVVGAATAEVLESYGYIADVVPQRANAETLGSIWADTLNRKDKVLLVQGRQSSPVLSEQLKEKECETDSICLYETRQDMRRIEECRRICPDMDYVVIASGTAAEAFKEVTDGLKLPKIVAIGPQTAKACEKAGLSVTTVAKKADSEGIAQAVLQDIIQAGNE